MWGVQAKPTAFQERRSWQRLQVCWFGLVLVVGAGEFGVGSLHFFPFHPPQEMYITKETFSTTVASLFAPLGGEDAEADEKREPLKSKNNKGLSSEKGCRKRKVPGSHEKDVASEKPGAVCPRTSAEPTLQRVAPASEVLGEELSQAMSRLGMGLEKEYAYDIFSSLMQKQTHYSFRGLDMPRSVMGEMRSLLIDWLVQVHEYLALADETLFLAVYLLNAYLKAGRVRVSTLQLLAATCLFLACKVEESVCPQPSQLCFMMEDSFNKKELLRMERKILARLKFELHYANPVHLLRLLAEVGHCAREVLLLAMYFLELSLADCDCLRFEPAQLSLAALGLAQRVLPEEGARCWDALREGSLNLHSYSESELSAVHPLMAKAALRGPSSTLRATFLKYSRPQKLCTSTSPAITASEYLSCFLGSPTP
ncbi:cyclin-P [Zootoca vivipara]|uniref:cyclin-P n=1 Tax=Zootoca vivipara TaxID=8524 RepID=UPI00293BA806|nr:cyclin-P [Zootoca vivipara]